MKIKKLISGVSIASVLSLVLSIQVFAVQANNSLELSIISQDWGYAVVELNVLNPSNQQITSVQSWLEFDADKLKWVEIDTTGTPFDFVVPGESNFDWNIVKIWRSTLSWNTTDSKVFVARITFEILKSGWEIRFHDYQTGDWWYVSIQVFDNWFPVNTLSGEPKPLVISAWAWSQSDNSSNVSNTSGSENNGQVSTTVRPSNVYLNTNIWSATLRWDQVLWSSKYYIYYWKTSWRYLNRRLVWNVNNYTIDWLESWKRYFFAITSIWNDNKESDYSNEVAVVIWNPKTSTSLYITDDMKIEKNDSSDEFKDERSVTIESDQYYVNNSNWKVEIWKTTESWPAEIAFISLFIAFAAAYWIKRFNGVKLAES